MNLKLLLYKLKQEYGIPIKYYVESQKYIDRRLGDQELDRQVFDIDKAILVPQDIQRKFAYDISYLAANKNFTHGALFDLDARQIVIDKADLEIIPNLNHYITINHKKFEFKKITPTMNDEAFSIIIRGIEGNLPNEIYEVSLQSTLRIIQKVKVS